ncbi:oxidoreductase [Lophiostoma macrostomum CBS 122681]|uniref:Oxidoreductase n=1 Tax=Lophiostoma macrostomum CBS 122681 TaxID=1314788 RepID=A0A6A6TAZ2_9PLEO|nr:oxidoreductase [Lophiostoma macrostomum CBS 122681]
MNRMDDWRMNSSISSFKTASFIPSLAGKTILVTGGTSGLGTQTLLDLTHHSPSRLIFTGRNSTSADAVIQRIKSINANQDVVFAQCDFTSLGSVSATAKKIRAEDERLDVIFCNAGIMAKPKAVTKDGIEVQFGINHVAHACLIRTLLPLLEATTKLPDTDVRVVSTSSLGFMFANTIPLDQMHDEGGMDMGFMGKWKRYGFSKLANQLYASELARRHPQITSVSVHPGVINTGLIDGIGLWNYIFIQLTTWWKQWSVEDGVKSQIWAAFVEKEKLQNGAFYEPVGIEGRVTEASSNKQLAGSLWEWTEKEIERWL